MTDTRPENERAGLQPGAEAKQTDAGNSATAKPEIDLQSWAKLGGIGKPSRTASKAKKSWIRGGI